MSNKINKDGLFYKLHKHFNTHEVWMLAKGSPVSLCAWFWKGIVLMAIAVVLGACALTLTGMILFAVVSVVTFLFGHFFGFDGSTLHEAGAPLVFIGVFLATVFGVLVTIAGEIEPSPEWINKPLRKLSGKVKSALPKPDKGPSTLSMYIKARKEKWCPMLTLEEEDNED